MSSTILVSGASGFVGSALVSQLSERGHRVVALRRASPGSGSGSTWDPASRQVHLDPAISFDGVVHLAGESIAQRWTRAARERIRSSRVDGTRLLCDALRQSPRPPRVLVCASATGFYGDRGDEILDEQSGPGTGFLSEVCQAWEAAAAQARQSGIRVVHLRLGIVLARHAGALAAMLPAFRLGLGARLGGGDQYWSWIALHDVVRVVELALHDDGLSGAVNAVAPKATTHAAFTEALARSLHRPAFLSLPAFAVMALFGQMGREALLASARVQPERLLKMGFKHRFQDLDAAFNHILAANNPTHHDPAANAWDTP